MADIISLEAARAHLRLEDDYPPEQLQGSVNAACTAAAQFLNRRLFATTEELNTAVAAVPAMLVLAVTAHADARTAADLVDDWESRCAAVEFADATLRDARTLAAETRRGLVVDDMVRAAILLMLGHLFQNRQDATSTAVTELPHGSRSLLYPYRIGLGV